VTILYPIHVGSLVIPVEVTDGKVSFGRTLGVNGAVTLTDAEKAEAIRLVGPRYAETLADLYLSREPT